jgi:hypothetical protein
LVLFSAAFLCTDGFYGSGGIAAVTERMTVIDACFALSLLLLCLSAIIA